VSIDVTAFGAIFIPLAVFVFFFLKSQYLLALLVISSVFQAASVVNVTVAGFDVGLPPYYFAALLVFLRYLFAISVAGGISLAGTRLRLPVLFLLAFWLYSVTSAFVFPKVFEGLEVYDPRVGIDAQYEQTTPLQWSFSNFGQAIYLTLNTFAILYVIQVVRFQRQADFLVQVFFGSILVVAFVGLYQRVASFLGLPFPYDFLNSNPVYSQGFNHNVIGIQRINATFTEPSYAGGFLVSVLVGLFAAYLVGKKTLRLLGVIIIVFLAFSNTLATTGYVVLPISVLFLMLTYGPISARGYIHGRYLRGWIAIGAILLTALAVVWLLVSGFGQAIYNVTFEKTESLSFVHRIASDLHSLELLSYTYGLGVGLGSNRPSSLITYILSNVGIIGFSLFVFFITSLSRVLFLRSFEAKIHMIFWSLLTFLIAQAVALPDINFPILWTFLILIFGLLRVGEEQRCKESS